MLNELIAAGADRTPDKAIVVASSGETTYAECAERAKALAAGLKARGITRFGCRVANVADLIALLGASAAIGAEACMYGPALTEADIATITASFDTDVFISDAPDAIAGIAGLLDIGELAADGSGESLMATPDFCPLMIMTTGTTGLPKGARSDWRRLVSTHSKRPGSPDARWLLAHAPNQYAGVSVLLVVLTAGATLIIPEAFQPRLALEAMRAHGVTHASATPTFWRFLLSVMRGASQDPLPLRQITLTGEAVPSALVDDIHKAFPDARIKQIYGATEFGSSVAVSDAENGLPASVLDRDESHDVRFKIVDGELHVQSKIGMLGYYGQEDVGDTWRPTGDLVEVRGDRIFFAGRATEIINVGGIKVHPLPIEDVIGKVDGVELALVYGRSSSVAGQIVAVDVMATPGLDEEALEDLEDAILDACSDLPPAWQPRRIKFVDDLVMRDTKVVRNKVAE